MAGLTKVWGAARSMFATQPYYASTRAFSASSLRSQQYFDKILVANRGEIACRVMRTCKRLGIRSVAIYSEPDENACHVKMADEAYCVGPAASTESYLNMDKILEVIKKTGAQAVHPGYGFLSENNDFVQLLEDNDVTFIGPNARAIQAMGDKIESKKVAKVAGVSVIPGFVGEVHDEAEVLKIANDIGYPVMIKASAGGGGKGMRVAYNDKDALEGFHLSKQEAMSSFGDDRMLIEKFIDDPRHIEIQVLADGKGTSLYLNERECSIQRRNQKVVEEAPSPFLTPEVREAMGKQAVALAEAVDYRSAGTVEMLVDSQRNFYFLEMNTRLQVEHPITELITGVDIVEQMIRVAAGNKLELQQKDIGIKGWAVESRIYAEDPLRNFLPSIGKLTTYVEPEVEEGDPEDSVRVDSGVKEGSEISMFYDPMISKLVTYGKDRQDAIAKMMSALDRYQIRGVENNINFVRDVMENPRFLAGDLTTKFIEEEYPDGFHGHQLADVQKDQLIAVAATMLYDSWGHEGTISGALPSHEGTMRNEPMVVSFDGQDYPITVELDHETGQPVVVLEDKKLEVNYEWFPGEPIFNSTVDGNRVIVQMVKRTFDGFTVIHAGSKYHVKVQSQKQFELSKHMPEIVEADTSHQLLSPMPGTLISVDVKVGDTVAAGQQLAVVEAMKMQNVLRAEKDGVVASIGIEAGTDVLLEDVILEFVRPE